MVVVGLVVDAELSASEFSGLALGIIDAISSLAALAGGAANAAASAMVVVGLVVDAERTTGQFSRAAFGHVLATSGLTIFAGKAAISAIAAMLIVAGGIDAAPITENFACHQAVRGGLILFPLEDAISIHTGRAGLTIVVGVAANARKSTAKTAGCGQGESKGNK